MCPASVTRRCAACSKNEPTPRRRIQRGYPPIPEADCAVPMEAVGNLYSQPYAARYPAIGRDEPPTRGGPTSGRRNRRARAGPPPTTTHTCGAAPAPSCARSRWIHMAYDPRHHLTHGRGRGAPGAGPCGSSARPPDPGLRPSERPCLRVFVPGFAAGRDASPGLARTAGVYAPARPLAPQSRTGTERPTERPGAAGPDPAQAAVHAQVSAWTEVRHAVPKGFNNPIPPLALEGIQASRVNEDPKCALPI